MQHFLQDQSFVETNYLGVQINHKSIEDLTRRPLRRLLKERRLKEQKTKEFDASEGVYRIGKGKIKQNAPQLQDLVTK